MASLTGHLMHVVLLAIECLGTLVVREGKPYAIQAQYPHPKGLMMTGKARVRQSAVCCAEVVVLMALPSVMDML